MFDEAAIAKLEPDFPNQIGSGASDFQIVFRIFVPIEAFGTKMA